MKLVISKQISNPEMTVMMKDWNYKYQSTDEVSKEKNLTQRKPSEDYKT